MMRIKTQNLTIYRNAGSKNLLINPTKHRTMSNLKDLKFLPVLVNDINSRNNSGSIVTSKINAGLLISRNKKLEYSPNRVEYRNIVPTNFNTLSRTTSSLLTNNKFVMNSSTKPVGLRHISTEAVQQLPVMQLTGFWKQMSENALTEFVQNAVTSFQSATHLPWWASIISITFIARGTLTLPLSLYQHYIIAKVQNLRIEMNDEVERLKRKADIAVSQYDWIESEARNVYNREVKDKWNELVQRDNCHPFKGYIVMWVQLPLWITISAALRNLCYMLPPNCENAEEIFLALTTGGFGWVVNLIDVDQTWILPICVGMFNLTNIEVMSLLKNTDDDKMQKYLRNFIRFFSIAMIPIASYVPSCICLYWMSSSAFGLIQNLVLLSPKVRRLGGIPWTPTEKQNPYRLLVKNFKAKKFINLSRKSTDSA